MPFNTVIFHPLGVILIYLLASIAYAFENDITSPALEKQQKSAQLCGVQNKGMLCPEGFCCSQDVSLSLAFLFSCYDLT